MRPVPKAGFFQVDLVWVGLKMPENARKPGKRYKGLPNRFLKKITWDSSAGLFGIKTTFPPIKTWSEGPILTNFWCPTTLLLWVEKKLLVKNDRKWHFLEFFQLAIGISQPLPTLIFPLWYSLPTLIPLFFLQCLSWWSGCHGYPAMTKKGLWEAPLTEFSPQTVQNLW